MHLVSQRINFDSEQYNHLMPSIIEGYNYDIFISYRQKDNKGDMWVSIPKTKRSYLTYIDFIIVNSGL